jgi:hypothetical protein
LAAISRAAEAEVASIPFSLTNSPPPRMPVLTNHPLLLQRGGASMPFGHPAAVAAQMEEEEKQHPFPIPPSPADPYLGSFVPMQTLAFSASHGQSHSGAANAASAAAAAAAAAKIPREKQEDIFRTYQTLLLQWCFVNAKSVVAHLLPSPPTPQFHPPPASCWHLLRCVVYVLLCSVLP